MPFRSSHLQPVIASAPRTRTPTRRAAGATVGSATGTVTATGGYTQAMTALEKTRTAADFEDVDHVWSTDDEYSLGWWYYVNRGTSRVPYPISRWHILATVISRALEDV